MNKIKQFFEEEMSGEPLTQEKVEWALQKFAALAWTDGYWSRILEDNGTKLSNFKDFLQEPYET